MSLLLQRVRSGAAVLLIALTACGGGDDGDGSDPIPPLQRNDPVRDWTFSRYSRSASTGITRSVVTAMDGSGTQVGGLLEKLAGFEATAGRRNLGTANGSSATRASYVLLMDLREVARFRPRRDRPIRTIRRSSS